MSHRFLAYANDESRGKVHPVPGAEGFLDAAVIFAESLACDNGELAVTVVDRETGEQHCFRIDLDSGEAGAC